MFCQSLPRLRNKKLAFHQRFRPFRCIKHCKSQCYVFIFFQKPPPHGGPVSSFLGKLLLFHYLNTWKHTFALGQLLCHILWKCVFGMVNTSTNHTVGESSKNCCCIRALEVNKIFEFTENPWVWHIYQRIHSLHNPRCPTVLAIHSRFHDSHHRSVRHLGSSDWHDLWFVSWFVSLWILNRCFFTPVWTAIHQKCRNTYGV